MKIVFLDRDTLSPQTHLRPPGIPHEMRLFGRTATEQVAERIADADVVIVNKVRLGREALAAAPEFALMKRRPLLINTATPHAAAWSTSTRSARRWRRGRSAARVSTSSASSRPRRIIPSSSCSTARTSS